ncbi:uncharacterized protein LOC114321362 [Camellia sinensis]|uniref:uncharacterized protein LOC114321362 n=1 Tax=Camellia sinensis TaxID=4442 RepID=UPI001036F088|nr:uncharacterized protein LOC114321362 [Camellia sinensis]XP_028124337.1 uncharacterized protein LOC114321362 [Camellia sinensis]
MFSVTARLMTKHVVGLGLGEICHYQPEKGCPFPIGKNTKCHNSCQSPQSFFSFLVSPKSPKNPQIPETPRFNFSTSFLILGKPQMNPFLALITLVIYLANI